MPTGSEVEGANCELTNSKGKWFVVTPGTVGISRSNDNMQLLCRKDGYEPGRNGIVSDTKGMMFGNIVFGGGIGAIIDHSSGAAYEYPSIFQIVMSKIQGVDNLNLKAADATKSQNPIVVPVDNSLKKKLLELKSLYDNKLLSTDGFWEQRRSSLQKQ